MRAPSLTKTIFLNHPNEETHTVYSYFILMVDIVASVILTLTWTKELELWTVPKTCILFGCQSM